MPPVLGQRGNHTAQHLVRWVSSQQDVVDSIEAEGVSEAAFWVPMMSI